MKKVSKIFVYFITVCSTLVLILASAGVLWIMTGPRSVPVLKEAVQKALNGISPEYSFVIGATTVQWDGWQKRIGIYVNELTINDAAHGKQVARFPDVRISLNAPRLLAGKIVFEDAEVIEPEINVSIPEEEVGEDVVTFGERRTSAATRLFFANIVGVLDKIKKAGPDIPIRNISLTKGKITIHGPGGDVPWQIPEAMVAINFDDESKPAFDASVEMLEVMSERKSFLSVKAVDMRDEGYVDIRTEITNVKSSYAADLLPNFKWLAQLGINISGKASIRLSSAMQPESVDFQIISDAENSLAFAIDGQVEVMAEHRGYMNVPVGKAHIFARDIPVDDLKRYWAPNFAADARDWVVASVAEGTVHELNVDLLLSPDDYVDKKISRGAISGQFSFSGVSVNYLEGFQLIKSIDGDAKFDTQTLTFFIEKAKLGGSDVSGTLYLTELDLEDNNMSMELNSTGSIEDIKDFLKQLDQIGGEGGEPLFDYDKVRGLAKTNYSFSFPLRKDLLFSGVTFSAKSEIAELSMEDAVNGLDLHSGNLVISADQGGTRGEGSAYIDKTLFNIRWSEKFAEGKESSGEFVISSYLTAREISALGGPNLQDMNGAIGTELIITQKGKRSLAKGVMNLADVEISVPNLGWRKKKGEAGSAEMTLRDNGGKVYKISDFLLKAGGLTAKGAGEIEKGASARGILDIKELKIGKTEMQVQLISAGKKDYVVNIRGKTFDANPILKNIVGGEEGQEDYNLEVDMVLENLLMANGQVIREVEGNAVCRGSTCQTFGLFGKLGKGEKVEIKLQPEVKDHVFSIVSNDGGEILRGLNVVENVVGGHFATSAVSPIKAENKPFEGKFIMKDFKVVKAPVLAKILTLASFTGVLNLLNGEGIKFDKMKGLYTFKNNVLKLREAKASGSALAITIEGDVNFNSGEIKLQGNIVPATLLNSILENIPLFGFAATAGGNESLIATRYTVTGKFSDPDVTVNPFSILTPGFLRNIWGDVVDKDNDEEELDNLRLKNELKEKKEEELKNRPAPIEKH